MVVIRKLRLRLPCHPTEVHKDSIRSKMVISVVHIAHAPSVLKSWMEADSSSISGSFLGRFPQVYGLKSISIKCSILLLDYFSIILSAA